jgi:hypothetical protein
LAAIENAIQTQPDEDEDEDEPENNNILAGILNDPTMKNLLIGLIANVAGSMMPKPQAVAGITDNETETEILQTIQKLFEKGVTVDDLKRLAAMDQGQITFLLSMLRK